MGLVRTEVRIRAVLRANAVPFLIFTVPTNLLVVNTMWEFEREGWGRMSKLVDVLPDSDTLILALNAIANINHYSCGSLDININYASVLIITFRFHFKNLPKLI